MVVAQVKGQKFRLKKVCGTERKEAELKRVVLFLFLFLFFIFCKNVSTLFVAVFFAGARDTMATYEVHAEEDFEKMTEHIFQQLSGGGCLGENSTKQIKKRQEARRQGNREEFCLHSGGGKELDAAV